MQLTIDHVGIACSDLTRTLAFYTRLLGGTAAPRAGHTVVTAGNVRLAFVPRREDDPPGLPWGQHLALSVATQERDAILARLAELGAEHQEVRGRIYTRDPDGFVIELVFE